MIPQRKAGRSLFECASLILACVCALPLFYFLFEALKNSSQLRDAMVVLAVVVLVLALKYDVRPGRPNFSRASFFLLAASYVFFIAGFFLVRRNFAALSGIIPPWGAYLVFMFSVFAGGALLIAAVGSLFFDSRRYIAAISGGFFCLSALSLFLQFADLPLRILAGKAAGCVLSIFGESVSLLAYKGEIPQIALRVNSHSYLVATECNGFGIISSCLILALVIAIFRRGITPIGRAGIVCLGVLTGFMANTLRIAAIIAVSLAVGQEHYYFYHELLGYVFFAAALVLTWHLSER